MTKLAGLAKAVDAIGECLGKGGYLVNSKDVAIYTEDYRHIFDGATALVALPANVDEVAAVVKICSEYGVPLVPQGGATSPCGGGLPSKTGDSIVLSLKRMNKVRSIDRINSTMTVDAGCILADIQKQALECDFLFPLSLGAEGSCTIGGNAATNAGGVNVLRYGNTRDLILGIEVVLPDGRILDQLDALRKNNTGYDLKHLFIGAEGTLGIITGLVLRLLPKPTATQTALVAIQSVAAGVSLLALIQGELGNVVSACELIPRFGLELACKHYPNVRDPFPTSYPYLLLVDFGDMRDGSDLQQAVEETLASGAERGLLDDALIASSQAQEQAFWLIREAMTLAQEPEGGVIKHDIAVPVSRFADFIAEASSAVIQHEPDARVLPFGHLGDGNVHFNICPPVGANSREFIARWPEFNQIVHDISARYGGTISAEHGIGQLKRDELRHYKSHVAMGVMDTIKAALDPKGIMNPGKLL
jgi:FAD/FMN-containing dehydrogenase